MRASPGSKVRKGKARRGGLLASLADVVGEGYAAGSGGAFWRHVATNGLDPYLGVLVLIQDYHLARHRSIYEALSAHATPPEQGFLLNWSCRKALDHLGYEHRICRALESLQLLEAARPFLDAPALAPTQALVGYLYSVAMRLGAVGLLGYSYWAEDCHIEVGHLIELLEGGCSTDGIEDLPFIKQGIRPGARTSKNALELLIWADLSDKSQKEVVEVVRTTLFLKNAILDACLDLYFARTRYTGTKPALSLVRRDMGMCSV